MRMSFCLILFFLTLLASSGCGGSAPSVAADPAAITVTRSGDEQYKEVKVTVTNSGGGILRVGRIVPSCTCTVATPIDKSDLRPGETTSFQVKIAVPAFGRQESTLRMSTNDPKHPSVEIPIRAEGTSRPIPYVESMTPRLDVGVSKVGAAGYGEIEIRTHEPIGSAAWIDGASCSKAGWRIEPVGEVSERQLTSQEVARCYVFSVTCSLDDDRRQTGIVTPTFKTPPDRTFNTHVGVELRRAIKVIPEHLTLSGTTDKAQIVIISQRGAFKILEAIPRGVLDTPIEAKTIHNVIIEARKLVAGASEVATNIELITDLPDEPPVVVPWTRVWE